MAQDDSTVTPDDVREANRATLTQSTKVARVAGFAIIVAGVVGLAAWLWLVVRTQQQAGSQQIDPITGEQASLTLRERIDIAVQSAAVLTLLLAAVTIASGFAIRLFGQYSLAQVGGSLTGFQAGDAVPGHEAPAAAGSPQPQDPGDQPDASEASSPEAEGDDQGDEDDTRT